MVLYKTGPFIAKVEVSASVLTIINKGSTKHSGRTVTGASVLITTYCPSTFIETGLKNVEALLL